MKCIACGKKYKTKGVKRCPSLAPRLCLKCSIEGCGSHSCDINCPDLMFPSPSTYPLSTSVVGLPVAGEMKGTTEEFLPRAFHLVSCDVLEIEITHESFGLLGVKVRFVLKGNQELTKQIYSGEHWKLLHIEDAVKEYRAKVNFILAPTLVMFPHQWLRIIPESIDLKVSGKRSLVLTNDTAELVGLPDCYTPLTKQPKPSSESYSYFMGKAIIFYTPLVFDQSYEISFNIEVMNPFLELGFLFPYRFVKVNNLSIKSNSIFQVGQKSSRLVTPMKMDCFPPRQEYEWKTRLSPQPHRPWIVPADPFRNQPLIGGFKAQRDIDNGGNTFEIDDYSVVQAMFLTMRPKNKEFISSVEVTNNPLPVRIYEQMQKLPRYRDFLISYDLINFSANPLELEITSEIKGYTDKAIDTIILPALGSGKSSRDVINQTPRLKMSILSKIANASTATLYYKILDKNSRKILDQGTKDVKLLPKDMIIWEIKDLKSLTYYDLSKMLGAWVTPTDSNGVFDKIRGKAKEYHPQKILVGEQGNSNLADITMQVKALYDYLNEKSGISYVNQPFCYDFNVGGQRVLEPERVVKAKTGNCIDLTILFASLMEGLGLNPLILLMPGHAFLGWGNKYKTSEMGFLETTVLGTINNQTGKRYTFEEASQIAEKTFKEKFLYIGSEEYLPLHSVVYSTNRDCKIVDLSEVRKDGIFRI